MGNNTNLDARREMVKIHSGLPAINVKVYNCADSDDIAERFQIERAQAEEIAAQVFDGQQMSFWNVVAANVFNDLYGDNDDASFTSGGRMSGWLEVSGLEDVDEWSHKDLDTWFQFEDGIKAEVINLCSKEAFFAVIKENGWHLPDDETVLYEAEEL